MKKYLVFLMLGIGLISLHGQLIISDNYNVTDVGTGFALGTGVNSGINPPTTRLTGAAATNLYYIKAYGSKADAWHYITANGKLGIGYTNDANSSTMSLSSGSGPYNFAPILGTSSAKPSQPLVYNFTINIANAAPGNQRCSFAISSAAGAAGVWDFGLQIYHANTADTFYTLQKRISTGAGGLSSAVNQVIGTAGTYSNEIPFLIRVTDAGAETATFNSRIQISINNGTNWIYDTATDTALPNGWRFPAATRYIFWDVAPASGPVTFDNFTFTSLGFTNVQTTNAITPTNGMILSDNYNVADVGTGFALGSGANSGINPPFTRLTGAVATNLYYIKAYGTKPDSCHYITNNSSLAVVLSTVDSSTLSLSAGKGIYDFGPILGAAEATPAQPLKYDLGISMANATLVANQRCSFALSSTPGTATIWDFGIQIYQASVSDNYYTLQKRISAGAAGLSAAINSIIGTVGTYPNAVHFLIRVSDAGPEAGTFNSRIQVSVDGGLSWIYDTANDSDLPNGFCFPTQSRYVFWDIASGTGPVSYDDFSLFSYGYTNTPPPVIQPLVIVSNQLSAQGFQLTWLSRQNTNYYVFSSTNIGSGVWVLATNLTGAGLNMTYSNGISHSGSMFYRIAQPTDSGLVVNDVTAVQRSGTNLVDINYNLGDLYDGSATISVLVSTDGGLTFHAAAASFSGDVGSGIVAGTNHHIVWNVGADWSPVPASNVVVEIVADRAPANTNMALVPGGIFNMGNAKSPDGMTNEWPVHPVQVDAFYAERYQVTKGLWDSVAQWATNNGYSFDSPAVAPAANLPVQQVSWYDAVKWCNARSEKEGLAPAYYTDAAWTSVYRSGQVDLTQADVRWAGAGYRLPTEAEWEKAARGGYNGLRFPWGDYINENLADYWSTEFESYDTNGTSGPNPQTPLFPNTLPVGSFPPSGFGLYDMVGNTWVWCWDYYGDTWYSNPLATNNNTRGPTSASWGGDRVYRGGSGVDNSWKCRVANRADAPPRFAMGHFGFRVVLPAGNLQVIAQSPVFSITP